MVTTNEFTNKEIESICSFSFIQISGSERGKIEKGHLSLIERKQNILLFQLHLRYFSSSVLLYILDWM